MKQVRRRPKRAGSKPSSGKRIRLIHWKAADAKDAIARLSGAGYRVDYDEFSRSTLREIAENPPDAVVIDLSRLPSQGRDVGLAVRHYKSTRHLPVVFVEGAQEKVARVKEFMPDATFTTWAKIRGSLRRAITHPPKDPVVPKTLLNGYSRSPLAKKLGIKANSTVTLVGAPKDFEKSITNLPEGVVFRRRQTSRSDLTIWFVKSYRDLERHIGRIAPRAGKGGLWIAWPKKSSGLSLILSQDLVRKAGLAAGLVDYKVCSIDSTWSGLRFARRK